MKFFKKKRSLQLLSLLLAALFALQVPITAKAADTDKTLDVSVYYLTERDGQTISYGQDVVITYTGHLNVYSWHYFKSDTYKTMMFGPVVFSDAAFTVLRRGTAKEKSTFDSTHSVYYYFCDSSFGLSKLDAYTKTSGYQSVQLPEDQDYFSVHSWFIANGYVDVSKDQLSFDPAEPDPDPDDPKWYQDLLSKLEGWVGTFLEPIANAIITLAGVIKDIQDFGISLLPEKLQDIYQVLFDGLTEKLTEWFEDAIDLIRGVKDLNTSIGEKLIAIESWCMDLSVKIWENFREPFKDATDPFYTFCQDKLQEVKDALNTIGQNINGMVPSVDTFKEWFDGTDLGKFIKNWGTKFDDMKDKVITVKDKLIEIAKDIGEINANFLNNLKNGFMNMSISEIMEAQVIYIKSWIVPSDSYLDNLKSRFTGVYDSVNKLKEGGSYVLNFLKNASGKTPPSITVNLSKSGKYYLGESVTIDFSWYAPYKPSVDVLLAGIIWATFLWNLFKRLPDILSGAGMITHSANNINGGD